MTEANSATGSTNGKAVISGRNKAGQFLPGHKSQGGRPLGSRNKLSEKFLSDVEKVWKRKGLKALEIVAENDPSTFCKIAASLIPKQLNSTLDVNIDLFAKARTRLEAYRMARDFIGAENNEPLLIVAEPVEIEAGNE